MASPVSAIADETQSTLPRPAQIARGVYVLSGAVGEPSPENLGRVANVGVIIGHAGIVVIGTGASDADGERLLASIGRLSRLPIELAINAYAGPEHVLGNSAFARQGIPILAHRATDDYMLRNCEHCLQNLQLSVGASPMTGSRLQRPSRLIDRSMSLVAGGRRLDILYYGPTQQPGSMAVLDVASGTLFVGSLASFDVIPDTHDADLARWIAALDQLRHLPLQRVVPARGLPGKPTRLDEVRSYLTQLELETSRAYERGLSLGDATASVKLSRFERWAAYDLNHRRNVQAQYLNLEARELNERDPDR